MVAKQQPQPAAPAAAGYADGKVPLAASTAAAAGTKAAAKGLPSPKAPTAAAAAAASAGGGSGPAPGAAHQAPAAVPAVAAASAPGAKPAVSRSSSLAAAHGNNASRRLQALLASEELSSLSVLDAEGSELPGAALMPLYYSHGTAPNCRVLHIKPQQLFCWCSKLACAHSHVRAAWLPTECTAQHPTRKEVRELSLSVLRQDAAPQPVHKRADEPLLCGTCAPSNAVLCCAMPCCVHHAVPLAGMCLSCRQQAPCQATRRAGRGVG